MRLPRLFSWSPASPRRRSSGKCSKVPGNRTNCRPNGLRRSPDACPGCWTRQRPPNSGASLVRSSLPKGATPLVLDPGEAASTNVSADGTGASLLTLAENGQVTSKQRGLADARKRRKGQGHRRRTNARVRSWGNQGKRGKRGRTPLRVR